MTMGILAMSSNRMTIQNEAAIVLLCKLNGKMIAALFRIVVLLEDIVGIFGEHV